MKKFSSFLFLIIFIQFPGSVKAEFSESFTSNSDNLKTDSLIFKGGNVVVGDIKSMSRGVLTIETDYSESDFTIDWEKVREFHSDGLYNIALSDKTILRSARLRTVGPFRIGITSEDGNREVAVDEIVAIRELETDFWSKISANVDLGFSITKANNLRQYSALASIGYNGRLWVLNTSYSQVESRQNDAANTRRTEVNLSANYQLEKSFYAGASLDFLSNTEQLLNLRTTGTVGLGYYFLRTTHMYWSGMVGISFNGEDYADSPEMPGISNDRSSYEGMIATELNLFDIGDISLFFNSTWYPSITLSGRQRLDLTFDIKYDLPYDFYISAGTSVNYDNQPVDGASDSDYVLQTGFGWSF